MKHLQLTVTEVPGRKSGRFTYQVIENGKVLYQAITDRVYVAMIILQGWKDSTRQEEKFWAEYRFGRFDLIGKGDSKNTYNSGQFYALARIDTVSEQPQTDVLGLQDRMEAHDAAKAVVAEAVIPVVTFEFEGGKDQKVGDRGFAAILADGVHVGRIPWAKEGINSGHHENTLFAVKEWAWKNFPGGFFLPYDVGQGDGYVCRHKELKPWMGQNLTFEQAVAALATRDGVADPAETYHLTSETLTDGQMVVCSVTPDTHRELHALFQSGVDLTNVVDVYGVEHVVDLTKIWGRPSLKEAGQAVKIIYLGDFDPSGLDMIRDIRDRSMEFIMGYHEIDLEEALEQFPMEVIPVALTKAQISKYKPPRNPAKLTDPRSGEFTRLHGGSSWEVDALRPEVLNQILEDAITELLDMDQFDKMKRRESGDKNRLNNLFQYLDGSDEEE